MLGWIRHRDAPPGLRPAITCEVCGHRHTLSRRLIEPETFHIVCHNCEEPLVVEFDGVHTSLPAVPR